MNSNVSVDHKIKLVVVNENILGYIMPQLPNRAFILAASILKGAPAFYPFGGIGETLAIFQNFRLASEKDFDEYRVSMNGYKNDPVYMHR